MWFFSAFPEPSRVSTSFLVLFFLLMNKWLFKALAPVKQWYEAVWTLALYRESSALGKRSYINQAEQIILDAMANAIKPLSNCPTLAQDENIDETPLNCLGWGLLKWAITAVNNPLLVLSTVCFFSLNAEWSGKCYGNSVAFNLLIGCGRSHSLTWLWQQECGDKHEVGMHWGSCFKHPVPRSSRM